MSTIHFQHGLFINCVILALFVLLSNTVIHAANIDKGPYLIYNGTNTEMEVLWQLDATQSCTLEWGTSTSYGDGSVPTTEYGTDHQHRYTITGLTPGTKYYYRVTYGGSNRTGSFNAAPVENATDIKLLAFGDTRSQPARMDDVAEQMIATYTSDTAYQTISLHSGDWSNTNTESSWTNEFFNRGYSYNLEFQANVPVAGCIGNHEGAGSVFRKYYPYPYEANHYWSFDYGPMHVVVIDVHQAGGYTSGSAQYNWLVNDLSASNKPWKIAVYHRPAYPAGYYAPDMNARNYLHPLFVQYGVQLVFNGHAHYYSRALVNDVHHIVTGGGGAPLYTGDPGDDYVVAYNKTYHHCEIDIQGNNLYFNAIKSDGSVIDTFTITIDTDPPTPDPAKFDSLPASASKIASR